MLADGDADMVSMARPLLADPDWVEQGARRHARMRSTPASPATRPASTTCSRTSARAAWSIRAPAPRPNSIYDARGDAKRIAVVGAGPGRPGLRDGRGRARPSRRRCSMPPTRSAASSTSPSAFPARKSSTRRCATSRNRIDETGVDAAAVGRASTRHTLQGLRRRRARHRRHAARRSISRAPTTPRSSSYARRARQAA